MIYVVCVKRPEYATRDYPPGSVVIDPFGIVPDREGVTVIRVGRK